MTTKQTAARERQQQILIVEDDLDLSEMLTSYFGVQGYKVLTAAWGKDAVKMAREKRPDLVVLDIRLPDIDGYEIARELRAHRNTRDMPVIFLTEKRDRTDRLAGLEMGAVDYLTKPFDIAELRLRVRNVLRRAGTRQSPDNPVTGLPEGEAAEERLKQLLEAKEAWALLVARLCGLERFRDKYGFVASDDVLRAVSVMVSNAAAASESNGDVDKKPFVGHLETHTLVVVTSEKELEALEKRVRERVGASMPYFYPLKDRTPENGDEKKRLRFEVGAVRAKDGPFEDVAALKEKALAALKKV